MIFNEETMSRPPKNKPNQTRRTTHESEQHIKAALRTGDFSQLSNQELCRAWLESFTGLNDAQLLASVDGISDEEARQRLKKLGQAAGLSADEVAQVAQGRLDLLSNEALDRIIAATQGPD